MTAELIGYEGEPRSLFVVSTKKIKLIQIQRRKHIRLPAPVPIKCESPVIGDLGNKWAIDISIGGVSLSRFKYNELKEGDKLKLQPFIRIDGCCPIVHGEVIRIIPHTDKKWEDVVLKIIQEENNKWGQVIDYLAEIQVLKFGLFPGELVGNSDAIKNVFLQIDAVARSDITVLILGESGTGKELTARAIHSRSSRREKPFVAVNCSSIYESLLESELFGHVKGAFTGAHRDHEGLFCAANGGTLFLDEIMEISPKIQIKLLRSLEQKEIKPVGSAKTKNVDVRIVSATNRNIDTALSSGSIREDFFYRLCGMQIFIPSLRERKEDIFLLIAYFMNYFQKKHKNIIKFVTSEAMNALYEYDWPGNARELQNVIERAIVLEKTDSIKLSSLPRSLLSHYSVPIEHFPTLRESEDELIRAVLMSVNGNKKRASAILKISRQALYKKMGRLNIK
ncbi:MAG: sigma 54-interacting transcriptional regulator [bacterium]